MSERIRALELLFHEMGYKDFRWIEPASIVVAQWVRLKCMYGCREYGRTAVCPPQVPSVDECARFFREYSLAAVFHFSKKVDKPEDRHAWTNRVNLGLLDLERRVFTSGAYKAFLLFLDSCGICRECAGDKDRCKHPEMARPTPEAMGVDVFATVGKIGYPIQVLPDYDRVMNRYAFLFIE